MEENIKKYNGKVFYEKTYDLKEITIRNFIKKPLDITDIEESIWTWGGMQAHFHIDLNKLEDELLESYTDFENNQIDIVAYLKASGILTDKKWINKTFQAPHKNRFSRDPMAFEIFLVDVIVNCFTLKETWHMLMKRILKKPFW